MSVVLVTGSDADPSCASFCASRTSSASYSASYSASNSASNSASSCSAHPIPLMLARRI